jgi:hypothetical protein
LLTETDITRRTSLWNLEPIPPSTSRCVDEGIIDTLDPHYQTRTVTIVQPGTQGFVSGDASRWTPWGGYLTAEESWGAGSVKGRLFEVTPKDNK